MTSHQYKTSWIKACYVLTFCQTKQTLSLTKIFHSKFFVRKNLNFSNTLNNQSGFDAAYILNTRYKEAKFKFGIFDF